MSPHAPNRRTWRELGNAALNGVIVGGVVLMLAAAIASIAQHLRM